MPDDTKTEAYQEFDRKGGTTHRVLDSEGVVHCCPAPGHSGCVVRVNQPVQF